jgi:hypothetical protein
MAWMVLFGKSPAGRSTRSDARRRGPGRSPARDVVPSVKQPGLRVTWWPRALSWRTRSLAFRRRSRTRRAVILTHPTRAAVRRAEGNEGVSRGVFSFADSQASRTRGTGHGVHLTDRGRQGDRLADKPDHPCCPSPPTGRTRGVVDCGVAQAPQETLSDVRAVRAAVTAPSDPLIEVDTSTPTTIT